MVISETAKRPVMRSSQRVRVRRRVDAERHADEHWPAARLEKARTIVCGSAVNTSLVTCSLLDEVDAQVPLQRRR